MPVMPTTLAMFCIHVHDPGGVSECIQHAQQYTPDQTDVDTELDVQKARQEKLTCKVAKRHWWLDKDYHDYYDKYYKRSDLHAAYRTVIQAGIVSRHQTPCWSGTSDASDTYVKYDLVGTFDVTIDRVQHNQTTSSAALTSPTSLTSSTSWKTSLFVYRSVLVRGSRCYTEVYYGLGWKDVVRCTAWDVDVDALPEPDAELFHRRDNRDYHDDHDNYLERLPRSCHRAQTCTMLLDRHTNLEKIMPTPIRVVRFLAGQAINQLLAKTHRVADLCVLLAPNCHHRHYSWFNYEQHVLLQLAVQEPSMSRRRQVEAYFKQHPSLEVDRLDEHTANAFSEFQMHFVREIKVKHFGLGDVPHLLSLLCQASLFIVQKRYRFRREHHHVERGFELCQPRRGKDLCVARRMPVCGKQTGFAGDYSHINRRKKHASRRYKRSVEHRLDLADVANAMDDMVDVEMDEQRQAQHHANELLDLHRDTVQHHVVGLLHHANLYDTVGFELDKVVAAIKRTVHEYYDHANHANHANLANHANHADRVDFHDMVLEQVQAVLYNLGFSHKVYCMYGSICYGDAVLGYQDCPDDHANSASTC